MAVPAGPVVVEGAGITALLGVSLLAICAWVSLVGLSKAYDYTLGALLHELGDVLDFKVWRFNVRLGGAFDALDHRIRDAIGAGITQLEASIGRLFHGLEYLVRLQWDTLAWFAHEVEDAFDAFYNGSIPQVVKHTTVTIVKPVREHGRVATARIARLEHDLRAGLGELHRDLTFSVEAALHGVQALRNEIAHDVLPGIRGLEHALDDVVGYTRRNLRLRISRLEAAILGGAVVGVALAALTRYFPWWQCTNVRGFNRTLCKAPIRMPEELFGFLLAAGVIANLEALVKLAQGVATETAEGIEALVNVGR